MSLLTSAPFTEMNTPGGTRSRMTPLPCPLVCAAALPALLRRHLHRVTGQHIDDLLRFAFFRLHQELTLAFSDVAQEQRTTLLDLCRLRDHQCRPSLDAVEHRHHHGAFAGLERKLATEHQANHRDGHQHTDENVFAERSPRCSGTGATGGGGGLAAAPRKRESPSHWAASPSRACRQRRHRSGRKCKRYRRHHRRAICRRKSAHGADHARVLRIAWIHSLQTGPSAAGRCWRRGWLRRRLRSLCELGSKIAVDCALMSFSFAAAVFGSAVEDRRRLIRKIALASIGKLIGHDDGRRLV